MKKKIKLRDLTKRQYNYYRNNACPDCRCKNCPFKIINCIADKKNCWVYHKDLFSDKFLDQEIEIGRDDRKPNILNKVDVNYLKKYIDRIGKNKILYICKDFNIENRQCFIKFILKDGERKCTPCIDNDKRLFAKMLIYRNYNIKELGL